MKSSALRFASFIALWAVFAGCGGDSSTGITDPGTKGDTTKTQTPTPVSTSVRINALLAEITNANAAASQGNSASGIPSGSPEPGFSPAGGRANFASAPDNSALCVLDSIAVRFNCPSVTQQNGLVVTMYFQLLDSASKPMLGFDTLKTVYVRRVSDRSGVLSTSLGTKSGPVPMTDTTTRHDDMLLNAARGAAHKLNGTGQMTDVLVPQGMAVAHISAPTTTENVGFFTDSTKHYPNSGKVTAIVTSQNAGQSPVTTTQVTSYDGTPIAKLTITLPGGKQQICTYDMTNAAVPPACVGP